MALLERVSTLIRANLNDLIDRAEDPEKSMKQVIRDIENQLLQVKTQVAITIADLHVLERKRDENATKGMDLVRKAELCVSKNEDAMARTALERSLQCRDLAANFDQQIGDQKVQIESLKGALSSLQAKLIEAQAKVDLLTARRRSARAMSRAAEAQTFNTASSLKRFEEKVERDHALGAAHMELLAEDVDARLVNMDKQNEIDRLLGELKSRIRSS